MIPPLIVFLGNDSSALTALHELSCNAGYRSLRCRPQEVTDVHAVLKRANADLVILDLWTARREDGWAFLRRLWADIETTHLPAIVVTGETDTLPIEIETLRMMHCQVMRKPFDARALRSEIEAALGPSPVPAARGNPRHIAPPRVVMPDYPLAMTGGGAAS